jgi:hypothetical protein
MQCEPHTSCPSDVQRSQPWSGLTGLHWQGWLRPRITCAYAGLRWHSLHQCGGLRWHSLHQCGGLGYVGIHCTSAVGYVGIHCTSAVGCCCRVHVHGVLLLKRHHFNAIRRIARCNLQMKSVGLRKKKVTGSSFQCWFSINNNKNDDNEMCEQR